MFLLVSCSAGGGTAPAARSDAASSTAGTTASPQPEPVDPCALLDAEDLAGLGAVPDESVRGLAPDPRTSACLVPHRGEGWAIYYGYSLRPGVSVTEAVSQLGTEKPVRLEVGDRARLARYHAYGDTIWHAWASQGRYSVMLELFAKPDKAQVERLLGRLLAQADPAMFAFPVDLPASCPPADSRRIVALLGRVTTATGSDAAQGPRCAYANRRGLSLDLNAYSQPTSDKVARSARRSAKYFPERSTPARGVTLMISPGSGYAFSSAYVRRPPSIRGTGLQQITVIGDYFRPLRYDEDAYRALARWWALQPG